MPPDSFLDKSLEYASGSVFKIFRQTIDGKMYRNITLLQFNQFKFRNVEIKVIFLLKVVPRSTRMSKPNVPFETEEFRVPRDNVYFIPDTQVEIRCSAAALRSAMFDPLQ